MFLQIIKSISFIFFGAVLWGCVSVQFSADEKLQKAQVKYTAPTNGFTEISSKDLDKLWRNTKDGATISYLSDCYNKADPSLDSIFKGITAQIDELFVVEKSVTDYAGREALNTVLEGRVDGVLTRFQLFIFKRNHCTYVLTYATAANVFGFHQNEFRQFVKGFHAP